MRCIAAQWSAGSSSRASAGSRRSSRPLARPGKTRVARSCVPFKRFPIGVTMGVMLTADMRAVIQAAHLCFAATVSPEGMPHVSPKGTIGIWDDQHLFFLDLASPGTRANLQARPWMGSMWSSNCPAGAIASSGRRRSTREMRSSRRQGAGPRGTSGPHCRQPPSCCWRSSGPPHWCRRDTGGCRTSGRCAPSGASGGRRWIRSSRPTWPRWSRFGWRAEWRQREVVIQDCNGLVLAFGEPLRST
jgi:hypothetical protein